MTTPELGDDEVIYRIEKVTLDNIPDLAKASGKTEEELSIMFLARAMRGQELNIRYRLIEEAEDGSDKSDGPDRGTSSGS